MSTKKFSWAVVAPGFYPCAEVFLLSAVETVQDLLVCLNTDNTLHRPATIPFQLIFPVRTRRVFLPLLILQVYVIIDQTIHTINAKIFVLNLYAVCGIIIIQILREKTTMKTVAKLLFVASAACATNAVPAQPDLLQPLIWRSQLVTELDNKQLKCLSDNIYYEARGEPVEGQIAVAQVTLNRVQQGRWGNTVCEVVYYKRLGVCQFSWVCKPQRTPNNKQYEQSQLVANRVASYYYTDVQYKYKMALHFHSNKVKPSWHKRLTKVKQTGNHIFYE